MTTLPKAPATSATWICSTAEQPWETMTSPSLEAVSHGSAANVRIWPQQQFQTIEGFGGCFNELGWAALSCVSDSARHQVLSSLFGENGCAFALARVPIGSSDFGLDAYSLDDTPEDFELQEFSIARDEKHLVPFIKAAMAIRPSLRCWASPWSPPAWMKTNNSYSGGSLRWEPPILQSFATYLVRWVEAYRAAGINIYALAPQNEPNILNVYPTCLWSAQQLREFIADYLGPKLSELAPEVELWLGLNGDPFHGGENINDRLVTVMEDPNANAFITGVAYQYDSLNQIRVASKLYPAKKFMQSETVCNGGENSWAEAERLYGLIKSYIEGGAGSYFAWNMVLDETGMSTWNWRQNALITADRSTGHVTWNGEYYVMRHFSQYVKPGAHRVRTTGNWTENIGFVNPDGSTVLVIANSTDDANDILVSVAERPAGGTITASLPPRSVSTLLVPPA